MTSSFFLPFTPSLSSLAILGRFSFNFHLMEVFLCFQISWYLTHVEQTACRGESTFGVCEVWDSDTWSASKQTRAGFCFLFLLEIVYALKEFKLCRFATQDLHEHLLRGVWRTPVPPFYVSFSDWITCSWHLHGWNGWNVNKELTVCVKYAWLWNVCISHELLFSLVCAISFDCHKYLQSC